MRRTAPLLALLLAARSAAALSAGGAIGGAVRANGASTYWNPAALGEFGGAWAGLVQVQGMALRARFERAGTDPNTGEPFPGVGFNSIAPDFNFSLVAPSPVKNLDFFAGGFAPVAAMVNWPEDGPNRYHATSALILAYAVPVGVLWRPSPRWSFAGGVGPCYGTLANGYHMDFGAYANGQAPPGSQPMPVEDPQLEGRVELKASGWAPLVSLGASGRPLDSLRFGLGLVWPIGMRMRGTAAVQSSPALDASLPGFQLNATGRLEVRYPMALQLQGEVEWSPGDWSLALIAQELFQGVRAAVPARISEANVDFLNGDQMSLTDTRNKLLVGGRVARRLSERWEVGARADYLPSSVPHETTNPGNMDFDFLQLAAAARWRFGERSLVEFSYTFWYGPKYSVTNSLLDPYAPPSSGLAAPSGNGSYALQAHVFSVNVILARAPATTEREAPARPARRPALRYEPGDEPGDEEPPPRDERPAADDDWAAEPD